MEDVLDVSIKFDLECVCVEMGYVNNTFQHIPNGINLNSLFTCE